MTDKSRRIRWPAAIALAVCAFALAAAPAAMPAPGDQADLGITKSDRPDPATAGQDLTYKLKVINNGPAGATNVEVTDNLPNLIDFVSVRSSQGDCAQMARRVVCDLGSLSPGGTATVTVLIRPRQAGSLTNTATVAATETDNQTANNSATETTEVNEASPPPEPPTGPSCRGVTATLQGTPGADRLHGTRGPDVIVAFAGNDQIRSGPGVDVVCAGRGNDLVDSGGMRDRVFGGPGADRLLGRGGSDLLKGGSGKDVLNGSRGDDRLRGGRGSDRCRGGAGADSLGSCER
jgi:uncharacterized repeat protein (TIGR01451 family)